MTRLLLFGVCGLLLSFVWIGASNLLGFEAFTRGWWAGAITLFFITKSLERQA